MAINIPEWRCCLHKRKLLTRVSSAGGFETASRCFLTKDSEFFNSEECNEHNSSA